MKRILEIIRNNWPQLIILTTIFIIAVINIDTKTYLTGGDNLHTELDISLNLKRTLFSVWQEYQGLGLLGGMGHASDLMRQLLVYLLSFIIPQNLIRYSVAFICLTVGSLGAFYLIRNLIQSTSEKDSFKSNLLALTGGLFYLLNLSTIQSYFVPFEAFLVQFAFLPWLIFATINYFRKQNYKNLLIVAAISVLASPMAYVPTLFIVFLGAALLISLVYFSKSKSNFIGILKYFLVLFLTNAFWLLPFLFFTATSTSINLNAKINQMATQSIYLQNKEFGGIKDVVTLKGFWLNYVEPNLNGDFAYMFSSWRNHLANPIVEVIGFGIFAIVLLGFIYAIKSKRKEALIPAIIAITVFFFLTTATPPFSWLNEFIRNYVPLFNQVFRFPFTKFSILASLSFAMLIPFGILFLLDLIKRKSKPYFISVSAFVIISLIIFIFPVFRENLFYSREKIKLPTEYFQTFDYFNTQNPNTRIANFPQYTFWGWSFYNWGYSGGGFIWYGLNQPVLDRNFDMWSPNNENYYWEISQAVYSKNPQKIENVLNKYDINYLLLDKNLRGVSPKSLFVDDFKNLISQIPTIKKGKEFGNIEIYKVTLKNQPKNWITSLGHLNSVNSYSWSNYDSAYQNAIDYKTDEKNSITYPFRSIFTGKAQHQSEFKTSDSEKYIEFVKPLEESNIPVSLNIPSLIFENNTIIVNLIAHRQLDRVNIFLELKSPEIYLRENNSTKKIWGKTIRRDLISYLESDSSNPVININGVSSFKINDLPEDKDELIGTTTLTSEQNNSIVISDKDEVIYSESISSEELKENFNEDSSQIRLGKIKKNTDLLIRIPKVKNSYLNSSIDPVKKVNTKESQIINCDLFRKDSFSYSFVNEKGNKLLSLSSKNASSCISFYLPNLDHNQGYYMTIRNKNIKGQPIHFWILNEDQKTPMIDVYLDKNKKSTLSKIIIPPMERYGKAYSFHFDNISIGNEEAKNILGKIEIYPIPYYFITNIYLEKKNAKPVEFAKTSLNVKHPNESLYLVSAQTSKPFAFALSQSYSPYWKAYAVNNFKIFNRAFPFIFGKEIKNHVKVNNWKNGWIVDESSIINGQSSIIVVYLPQYLQYVGFALTTGTLIGLIYAYLKHRKKLAQKLT